MQTIKILGVLLTYPTAELQQHIPELKELLEQESLLPRNVQKSLFGHMNDIARRPLIRLQEEYVALFDRSRAHSLYLFEHVHGEGRDRGQAMVDLMRQYKDHGFEMKSRELPDYLPMFLEFLSLQPFDAAQDMLGEIIHIVGAVGAKLKTKKNGYHQIYRALESLTEVKADQKYIQDALVEAETADESLEALDREWEETPAFDGIGKSDCSVCPQAIPQPSLEKKYVGGHNG